MRYVRRSRPRGTKVPNMLPTNCHGSHRRTEVFDESTRRFEYPAASLIK